MRIQTAYFLTFLISGILLVGVRTSGSLFFYEPVTLDYPDSWPEPAYNFDLNPLTKQKIELGRKLFYDPILSADNTISCSSCHLSYTAFTHVDHALSHGIGDSIGNRNSPSLMNLAWSKHFMWDGAINHLDMQALAPISHPAEMGNDISTVVDSLNESTEYRRRFNSAFGDSTVTGQHVLQALSQFQLTLVSANSLYDQMVRGEIEYTEQQQRGYELFRANCNSCHQEPLFTTGEFANNGLSIDTMLNDWGRMVISQRSEDSLAFKIPTLRNVEFSHPYMHDGRFKTLREVLTHYRSGITESATLAPGLSRGVALTSNETTDLVAFLLTLTDKEFLFNRDFAFPR